MKKGVKKMGNRISAWLLTLVMIVGLVAVPAGEVKAAEVTGAAATNSSSPVYVDFALDSKNSTNTYNQYGVNLHNNSGGTICDWTIKIQFTVDDPGWNNGWNGAEYDSKTKVLTIKTYGESSWNNATIYSGDVGSGAGFQVKAGALDSAKVTITYSTGESQGGPATGKDPSKPGGSTDFGTTRDYSSGVTAKVVNQGTPSNDWSGFEVNITNNSGETICDWIVVLKVPSGTASAFKCWSATFVADGDTIYLYPMQSGANAVIAPGELSDEKPGGGFVSTYVDASQITVEKVWYNKGTSSDYDYSSGETNDDNNGDGDVDWTPDLNPDLDLEYNYAKLLQYSLYFYDANMCGTDVTANSALSWRKDCHKGDASVTKTINGKTYTIDVSGGYHDAGDHPKFGLPQAYSASVLGLGYAYFKDAYDELGQSAHLKNILDRFVKYFENCTILDGNGNVVAFCYQVGDGNVDHGYWGPAEEQETKQGERDQYVWLTDSSTPCTDIVAETAAALAIYAANYKETDSANASKALDYAKKLLAYAESFGGNMKASASSQAAGFYNGSSYKDDLALASIWIHNAIGDSDTTYKGKYNTYVQGCSVDWLLSWDDVSAAAYLEGRSASQVDSIMSKMRNKDKTPQGFTCVDGSWGSARYNTALQFTGLAYDKLLGDTKYDAWATSQMQYLLGSNNAKQCYVIGYNENDPKHPHHRSASGYYDSVDDHASEPMAHTLYGALVGGPNAQDNYIDLANKYQYAEVAIDYNAAFVGAAAALYLLNKDDGQQKLVDSGLSEVKTYYLPGDTDLKDVTLDKTNIVLSVGEEESIKAVLNPTYAKYTTITWSASPANVVSIADSGTQATIKALKPGETTITVTVTTADGSYTATCNVTVTKEVPQITVPTSITVDAGTMLKSVSLASCTSIVKGTFSWKEADKQLTYQDNGGTFTVVFTPTDTASYETVEKTVKLKVNRIANTSKPAAPTVKSRTAESVTLTPVEAVEYGISSGNGSYDWQTSNVFDSLSSYTTYTFAMRFAQTDIYNAGAAGASLDVTTYLSEAERYVVDLSKIANAEERDKYIEAHNGTISYDKATNTVTLNENKAYTITGTAEDVTIDCGNAPEVTLKNARFKKLKASKDVVIKLIGNNYILEGITSSATVTIENGGTSSNPGSLTVTGDGQDPAIKAKNIVINSGHVNATATGNNVPALEADEEIQLNGGSLTANSDQGTAPVDAPKIVWDGCAVESDNKPIFSERATLVDGNGKEITDMHTITYVDADTGKTVATATVAAGAELKSLEALPKKAGYKADGWYTQKTGGNKVLPPVTITEDVSYYVRYVKIEGKLQLTVDEDTRVPLMAGYTSDAGVRVTVTNGTDATIDGITLTLDNSNNFTLEPSTITDLAPNTSTEVRVKLGSRKPVNEIGYTVNLTASCDADETEPVSIVIKRKVVSREYCYTVNIDPSNMTDDKYIKAHNGTISYDKAKNILYLNDKGPYTITGSNPGLKICAREDVIIILEDADIGGITGEGDIDIRLKGDSSIDAKDGESGIETEGKVTITKDEEAEQGSLDVEGGAGAPGIKAGEVVIEDGDVTVKGGSNAPGIEAGEVVIEDGDVTVEGGSNAPGIKADKVVVEEDGDLTVTGKGNNPAIDSEEEPVIRGNVTQKDGDGYTGSEDPKPSPDPEPDPEPDPSPDLTVTKVKTITISVANTIEVGEAVRVNVKVTPEDADDDGVLWSSSNNGVLTVSEKDGNVTVTAVAVGTADIIATAADGGGATARKTITVIDSNGDDEGDDYIEATSLKVTASVKGANNIPVSGTMKLAPKKTMTLNVEFLPAGAEEENLTFTSSNTKIATVNKNGKITAKKTGKATITVESDGGLKKTIKIQVMKKAVSKVKVKASKTTIKVKKTVKLKATLTPNKKNASNNVFWKSSKPKVATVSSKGVVKGLKKGKTKITAIATDGSGKKATITIQVK